MKNIINQVTILIALLNFVKTTQFLIVTIIFLIFLFSYFNFVSIQKQIFYFLNTAKHIELYLFVVKN